MSRTRGRASLRVQRFRATTLQLAEIFPGQIEPVDVIDAQPSHRAGRNQLEQKPMCFLKNFRQLHPNRGQVVDIKETAIIDLFRRDPPEGEAISLIAEQGIERVETARIARVAV